MLKFSANDINALDHSIHKISLNSADRCVPKISMREIAVVIIDANHDDVFQNAFAEHSDVIQAHVLHAPNPSSFCFTGIAESPGPGNIFYASHDF
jgi:hypothetical protein